MIKGIGTDIVAIERIEKTLNRQPLFAKRILTDNEYNDFGQAHSQAAFLAKRFAAKEAVLKALGTGLAKGMTWQDIEVRHDDLGKPWIHLEGEAQQRAHAIGVQQVHVSISDERQHAIAFVVME